MGSMNTSARIKKFYAYFTKHNTNVVFPSLKAYVRSLVKGGNEEEQTLAKRWLSNKKGTLERAAKKEREANKGALNRVIAAATKQARRKKKGPGGKVVETAPIK